MPRYKVTDPENFLPLKASVPSRRRSEYQGQRQHVLGHQPITPSSLWKSHRKHGAYKLYAPPGERGSPILREVKDSGGSDRCSLPWRELLGRARDSFGSIEDHCAR
jgi:hypothetical protein